MSLKQFGIVAAYLSSPVFDLYISLCSVRILHCTVNYTHQKQDWIIMQPQCRTVLTTYFNWLP